MSHLCRHVRHRPGAGKWERDDPLVQDDGFIPRRQALAGHRDEAAVQTLAGNVAAREFRVAENRADRRVRRVPTGGDADQAVERRVAGGVEDELVAADEGLEAGVEIRRV